MTFLLSSLGLRGYFAYQEATKTAPIKVDPVYHHMMPGSLRPLPDLPATVAGITATQVKTCLSIDFGQELTGYATRFHF